MYAGLPRPTLVAFPGSAWERNAPQAPPADCANRSESNRRNREAEPRMQCVPGSAWEQGRRTLPPPTVDQRHYF
jgi:hypothetical protein